MDFSTFDASQPIGFGIKTHVCQRKDRYERSRVPSLPFSNIIRPHYTVYPEDMLLSHLISVVLGCGGEVSSFFKLITHEYCLLSTQ